MFLERLKLKFLDFLSDWLYALIAAAGCFIAGTTNGLQVFVALQHNLGLNGAVTWYGRGNGNIQQEYVSTLLVYSILWLTGGVAVLVARWLYERAHPKS